MDNIGIKERNMIKRIVVYSEDGLEVELSAIFSIDNFFDIWCNDNNIDNKYEKWIKNTYPGENENDSDGLKRIHRIFFLGINDNDVPFAENRYTKTGGAVRHFNSGSHLSNARRKTYIEYLLNNNIEREIKRQEQVLGALFDDIDDEYLISIKTKLDDFLGPHSEECYSKECKGSIDVMCDGFFDIMNTICEKEVNIYRVYNPLYNIRFDERFKQDPLDAVARLFILLLAGGYALNVIDLVLPNMGGTSTEESESEYLYNRFTTWYSKIVKPYSRTVRLEGKGLYDDAVNMYKENKKTLEVYFVMGKIRKEITWVDSHFDGEPSDKDECIIFLLKHCIECGELKNKIDSRTDEEKNYLKIIAEASYELFDFFYKNRELREDSDEYIKLYLKKSAQYNHTDACNIIGDLLTINYIEDFPFGNKYAETLGMLKSWNIDFLNGESKISGITEYRVIEKAIEYYEKAGDGHAYLRIAQCLETNNGSRDDIINALAEAYKRGEYDARKKMNEYINYEKEAFKKVIRTTSNDINEKKVCILCSCSYENIMFLKTLPSDYKVIIIKNEFEQDALLQQLDEQSAIICNEIIEAFNCTKLLNEEIVSDGIEDEILIVDYGNNIIKKCEFLQILFDYFKFIAQRYDNKYFLSEKIKLCIDFNESMTELHIDRLERDINDMYIPVYDNIYEKNASFELLSKMPLFSMDMGKSNIKTVRHIVILGSSKVALQILRDMVSICVYNQSVHYYIHLVDSEADRVKKILMNQCADIVQQNQKVNYKLEFNTIDKLEYLNSKDELEYTIKNNEYDENENNIDVNSGHDNVECCKIPFVQCDYYVCATDEDMLNIELAKSIRTWGLRYTDNYFDLPVVAVLNKDKKIGESLEGISISTSRKIEYPWYEGLNLMNFGALQDYYSYNFISNNWIKGWGMAVHLAYSNREDAEERHLAYNDFYSRWYNRDSSYMSAIFFIYRFYNMGMFKSWYKWDFYRFMEEINLKSFGLLNKYNKYILNPENKEKQAELEHARWCEWLKSKGWTNPKDYNKVEAYMKAGSGYVKHQLHTAKIHPYLISWEDLGQRTIDIVLYELNNFTYKYNCLIGVIDSLGMLNDIKIMIGGLNEYNKKSHNEEYSDIITEVKNIINKLEQYYNEFDKLKEDSIEYTYIVEYLQICINRIKETLFSEQVSSTGLQAKVENWYRKYLNKPFIGSIKGHDLMIVSRTSDFIEYGQRIIEEKTIE